jgi:hypothetical protein
MNNIHLLPTDKPSRLWTNNLRRRLELDEFPEQHPTNIAKHIYITNSEEIKEGDWFINELGQLWQHNGIVRPYKGSKKIILTTDQDLITDGVQAIDDSFLEWFVKNPSCEEIKVFKDERLNGYEYIAEYKIIIPQEEPKQERMYSEEDMQEYAEFCIQCFIKNLPCIVAEDWFKQFKKNNNE